MEFSTAIRERCQARGIDIERSYALMQQEIMVGGPVLGEIADGIGRGREAPVTRRQAEVLDSYSRHGRSHLVARELRIGVETVRTHLADARVRLGARTSTHAVAIAIRRGII